jgi:hypothetical protein
MTTRDIRCRLGQIVSSEGATPGSIKARLASLRGIADNATNAFTAGEISAKGLQLADAKS